MKIGIITYHCVSNFGAQLQTISTVGFLKNRNHDPMVIHWYPKDLEKGFQERIQKKQYDKHISFAQKYMPLTARCTNETELVRVLEENSIEAVILGSDALFKFLPKSERKMFSKSKLRIVDVPFSSDRELDKNPFWGSFIPKLKKEIPVAVFSVSSQNCPYYKANRSEYQKINKYLAHFKHITVRDSWTKDMVKYFAKNINAQITPDPVFSFNSNNYLPSISKDEILKKFNLPDKYVLLSFKNKKIKNDFFTTLAHNLIESNYTPVAFPHPEGLMDFGLEHKIQTPLSPLDWYYLIKYSHGYIGDRMHPIVTALHNAIPFFSFDHYGVTKKTVPFVNKFGKYIKESSKIYDLLSMYGLSHYIVQYKHGFNKVKPKHVANMFLTFDIEKAKLTSNILQNKYEEEMDKMLSKLVP